MKHLIIYTFALFALAFGCAERAQEQNFKVERDTIPLGLRVIPGQSWALWSPNSDSAFNLLSQNFSAEQERILTWDSLRYQFINDSTVRGFAIDNDTVYQTLTYTNDTLTISDGNSVVITSNGASLDSIGLSLYEDSLYVNTIQTAHINIPIADRGFMEYWNAAINDTSTNRVTNVIVYGDSNTEFFPEAFTIPIRDILTDNFGGAGYGWMNMRSDRQDHVDLVDLGTWYNPASNAYGDLSLDRFDRTWYADSLDGIEYEFTPASLENGASAAKSSAKCKMVELHYYGYGSSQVRAEITNEINPTTFDTLITSPGYNVWKIALPEFGYHDATFQIISGDSIRAMGINFTTPDTVQGRSGVVVHRIGHSGATADEFHGIADTLFRQQIQNLEADLIIFQLGGNSYGNTSGSKSELDSLINKVRVWNDSISIAILVPNANGTINEIALGKTHDRNYWYLSKKYKTGFGSLFQLHGPKWIADSAGLFYSNGAHFTPIGGRINGEFICSYVLGVHNRKTPIEAGDGVTITGQGIWSDPYNISSNVLDINVYEDDDTLTGNRIMYARSGHYFAIAYDGDVNESMLVDLNTNIISQLRMNSQNANAQIYATALSGRTLPTGGQSVPGPGAGFITTNTGRRFIIGQVGSGSQGGVEFHAGTNLTYPGFHFVKSESDTLMTLGTGGTEFGELMIGHIVDQGDHNLQVQGSALIDSIEIQGMKILAGSTEPTSSQGSQGSLYMRNDNDSTLYTKTGTGWVLLN